MTYVSPFDGHPDFVEVRVSTPEERQSTLVRALTECKMDHGSRREALECVTLDILKQLIAECAASSMGADDPDAADVGWALAEAIMLGARVNAYFVALLGDVAQLCITLMEGKPLPEAFRATT